MEDKLKLELLNTVQFSAPYKTGKLKNSFHIINYPNGFGIRTEIDHMKYTEEAWTYNSRWQKGLKNPNEGWFKETTIVIAEAMAKKLGGKLNVK